MNLNEELKRNKIVEVDEVDLLVLQLYSLDFLPIKKVFLLKNIFKNFYDTNLLRQFTLLNDELQCKKLNNITYNANAFFDNYKTNHLDLKRLESLYYIPPKEVHVGTVLLSKRRFKRKRFTKVKINVMMIPLKEIFKKFSQLPNVFKTIQKFIKRMEECSCNCSIFKSKRWQKIKCIYSGKIVIPFMLNGDDVKINNPLGSHKGVSKIHTLYCTVYAIPPAYSRC